MNVRYCKDKTMANRWEIIVKAQIKKRVFF